MGQRFTIHRGGEDDETPVACEGEPLSRSSTTPALADVGVLAPGFTSAHGIL